MSKNFDPWEHLNEEEGGVVKIKAPKVKKVKKDKEFNNKKNKKRK